MSIDRGQALHARVPAERWCITEDDLEEVGAVVRSAVASAGIAGEVHFFFVKNETMLTDSGTSE